VTKSASALDRLFACPPSDVITPRAEESGEQAERGTAIHEFLRRKGIDRTDAGAIDCVPLEWRKTCSDMDFDTAIGDLQIHAAEPAYAMDALDGSVKFLGLNIDRQYEQCYGGPIPGEVYCCSLDVEGSLTAAVTLDDGTIVPRGTKVAADYKTGIHNKSAEEMWQLRLQCYILMKKWNVDCVLARVIYIDMYGKVHLDQHLFTYLDLEDVPKQLLMLHQRIESLRGKPLETVYPGSHCKYCPALRSCPAQMNLVRAASGELDTLLDSVMMMTPAQAYKAYGKLKEIENAAEKVKTALKLYMDQHGEELIGDDGYKYVVGSSGKTYLPADLVRGLLTKYNVPLDEIQKITKVSKFAVVRKQKIK
jgi:Protein of unknown function (DUF2800)